MFGIFAYASATAGTNSTLTQLNALADQSLAPVNNNIQIPGAIGNQSALNQLSAVLATGVTMTGAQLQSPSLRQLFFPDIRPIENVAWPPLTPSRVLDLRKDAIQLASGEQMSAFITNTANDKEAVLVLLSDGNFPVVGGEIQTVKATGTTTLVSMAWTNAAITISQNLPAGRYAVVGLRYEGTTALAARILFPGGYWRPGCPGVIAKNGVEHPMFRMGGLGNWGEFSILQLPTIDCLAGAADTAQTFWLDLIQVSTTP